MDGTFPPEDTEPEDVAASPTDAPTETWVLGGLLYSGEMTPRMRTMVGSLRAQLEQGDRNGAIETCRRLLQMERHFVDAHLWLAKLSKDEENIHKHAGAVLAMQPGNAEATRLMLVARGEMTAAEAERSKDLYHDNVQVSDDAVDAQTNVLLCPICRGGLTIAGDGHVECAFCGYVDEDAHNAVRPTSDVSLAVSLIKQRGKAVRWKVGERMVHCNECGAERVLPEGKMSGRCPFCNSNHVIVQDNLGAFRQPDAIVKFKLKRQRVEDIVHGQLESRMEKLKGLFTENRVDRIYYSGVFLPFWVFDVFGTVIIRDTYRDASSVNVEVARQEFGGQLQDLAIPAVDSPPRSLTRNLGRWDYSEKIAYTPKLLSKFAAELYVHDFDVASLEARELFRKEMQAKNINLNPNETRTVSTMVDHMDMELLLLPVWVATIIERDG
ncbi:MAG: hypothetical protein AAFR22_05295, partial [Chloroflexota bacterium]